MKRLKIIGIIIGSFIVVLAIGWLILNHKANRMLEAELEAIRKTGEPLTFAEFAPPPVPDDENAALLYEQAFGLVSSSISYFSLINDLMKLIYRNEPETPELIQSIRRIVNENKNVLRILHEGSSQPKCRYAVDYSNALYAYAEGPNLGETRSCAYLLAGEAIINLKDNKPDEALKSCQVGLKFTNSLNQPPGLISCMIRVAILDIILNSLKKVLDQVEVEPLSFQKLLDELNIQRFRNDFTKSYLSERCMGLESFKDPFERSGRRYLYSTFLFKPIRKRDQVYYLRLMTKIINISRLPNNQARIEFDKVNKEITNAPSYYLLTRLMLPFIGTPSHMAHSGAEAHMHNTRFALALKIYKSKHGEYPDALSALTPDILESLPLDPFNGKDFTYRKKNEGFIVYSVGQNLIDNGGLLTQNFDEGDTVWECEK